MHRGEVWLINLEPTVGAEIRKTRPAVIVNDDAVGLLPLRVIVPITEWKDRYDVAPWMVQILPSSENGLDKLSSADAFQVRSLAHQRFVRKLGHLSDAVMWSISRALATVLNID
jgi:mRNA interferase MazF